MLGAWSTPHSLSCKRMPLFIIPILLPVSPCNTGLTIEFPVLYEETPDSCSIASPKLFDLYRNASSLVINDSILEIPSLTIDSPITIISSSSVR